MKILVSLTISNSTFQLFICSLLFYINRPHHCFLKEPQRKKGYTASLCYLCHHTLWRTFYHNFTFNEFIFVYILNIFICNGEIYLITYLHNFVGFPGSKLHLSKTKGKVINLKIISSYILSNINHKFHVSLV